MTPLRQAMIDAMLMRGFAVRTQHSYLRAEFGLPVEMLNWRGFFAVPGVPDERLTEFVEMLEQLHALDQWQSEVARYGWVERFMAGDEFVQYLESQEAFIGQLMTELGFIEGAR